jgi:hypothetical protein
MAEGASYEPESDLPPPGSRWGSGAQSVLPYLTKSLQARPAAVAEVREQRGPEAATKEGVRPSA